MDQKKKLIVGVVGVVMIGTLIFAGKQILGSDKDGEANVGDKLSILLPTVDKSEIEETTKKTKYDHQQLDTLAIEPIIKEEDTIMHENDELRRKQLEEELARIMEIQKQIDAQRLAQAQYTPPPVTNVSEQVDNVAQLGKKNHFYGAGTNANDSTLDLVQAETVDQKVVINGSTIAIRTKEEITLTSPRLTIPKDAIVYGKVRFTGVDRLEIEIVSYKTNKKLYNLNLQVYDFDGREGVHLTNRSWTKIPSKVSKDVFEYVYNRGTQQPTFGGNNNRVDLKEAKNIGILSATRELAAEVFDKRRVLMPRKYHLWINVRANQSAPVLDY